MKRRDFTPLAMWIFLFAGIIIMAVLRSCRGIGVWEGHPVNVDTVFICLYLFLLLTELRVSRNDVDTEGKKASDYGTCQLYGCGQAFTILTALWFPSVWTAPNAGHMVGLGMLLTGAGYRLWAVRTLGRYYSHKVQTAARHQIIASGPYRFTRHPAYAGMILANAGVCVYFFNWVTVGVCCFVLLPAILLRIVIEERVLFGIEGYAEYAEKRKRLMPAVW